MSKSVWIGVKGNGTVREYSLERFQERWPEVTPKKVSREEFEAVGGRMINKNGEAFLITRIQPDPLILQQENIKRQLVTIDNQYGSRQLREIAIEVAKKSGVSDSKALERLVQAEIEAEELRKRLREYESIHTNRINTIG